MNCEILTTRKGMHFQAWQFNSRVQEFWNGIVQTQWLVPENIVDSTGKYFDMKWHDGRVSSDPVCETNFQIAWAWPPLKKNDVDWSDQETTTSTLILRMMGTNGQKAKKLPCFALLLATCFLSGEFSTFLQSISSPKYTLVWIVNHKLQSVSISSPKYSVVWIIWDKTT